MLLISEEIVIDTSGVRALRAELFQSLWREMPLPEVAGQARQKRTCTPTSATWFAYVISGRGGSVAKHRAVHCGVRGTGYHPVLQPQQQRWQSLGERSCLSERLGIGLLGCFGQGRLQWVLFFSVLNFSTSYLLIVLFLCVLHTCLTRLTLHVTEAFEVWLLICVLPVKQG